MLLDQNAVNSWELNFYLVNGGDSISPLVTAEEYVSFNAEFENKAGSVYYMISEVGMQSPVIKRDTALITPEEDVSIFIKDRSDAGECRVDVNMFTDVGISWDNYVKTTFYPLYSNSYFNCPVVIKRPITPDLITSTSSMVSEGILKQWAYYINNTSDTSISGTIGVVAEVVIDNNVSMRAMGSLITDNNTTEIANTSEMDGGQGLIFIDGYLKLDLDSNECCVYPEAQTEEDIDCNVN